MSYAPARLFLLPRVCTFASEHAALEEMLERVELLVPEVALLPARDVQAYALAFIERYRHDVPLVESAWELLYAALAQAWGQRRYEAIVLLVEAMARAAGRCCTLAEAEQLLRIGIEASRRLEDHYHFTSFLNRLGGLLFTHGSYWQGRQMWSKALKLAWGEEAVRGLWEPLASFAHIVDIISGYVPAQQFVETLRRARHIDDPESMAVALFARGFYARLMRDFDMACEDLSCCLRLVSVQEMGDCSSPERQLFTVAVLTELARAQGDYRQSRDYAESTLALARAHSDLHTQAVLLIDMGLYASWYGKPADVQVALQGLREIACKMRVPHVYNICRYFEGYVAESSPGNALQARSVLTLVPPPLLEALSERELEVLRLVADGLSNRQVAARLVVTTSTVKKHLEHIYSKLDAHSRTAAVARAREYGLLT